MIFEQHFTESIQDTRRQCLWLSAGFFLSPRKYFISLITLIEQNPNEVWTFFSLIVGGERSSKARPLLPDIEHKKLALKLLCRALPNVPLGTKTTRVDEHDHSMASLSISGLVNQISSDPSKAASVALDELCDAEKQHTWNDHLLHARASQKQLRRQSEFTYPEVGKVCDLLINGPPVNSADLRATLIDVIRDMNEDMRYGNRDAWKIFWNTDSWGRPTEPKVEDICRDGFLSLIQARLKRILLRADPEGHFASDKRADIVVTSPWGKLPVEVKRESHSDLWHAFKTQLARRYTIDPEASGQGIYLVFWFGGEKLTSPPQSVSRPSSAEELQTSLQSLSENAREYGISVLVVDVSIRT